MSPKRGDRVAPPARDGEYEVRFLTSEAAKGWEELCQQVPGHTSAAWWITRTHPDTSEHGNRHHRMKGTMATESFRGKPTSRWQSEVTSAGRIWYPVDEENRTVWIDYASPRHPEVTE